MLQGPEATWKLLLESIILAEFSCISDWDGWLLPVKKKKNKKNLSWSMTWWEKYKIQI